MNFIRMKKITPYILNFKTLIESVFKDKGSIIYFLLGILVSSLFSWITTNYSIIFALFTVSIFVILILIFTYYIFKFESTEINDDDKKFYMVYSNPPTTYNFKTPSLMLDKFFNSEFDFEIKIGEISKNKFKNNKITHYTLVVEKDKSITVNMSPEYVEDNDKEYSKRNDKYYYFVQEYDNQNSLKFKLIFSSTNKININPECKIYFEYGDIHDNKNLKNKLTTEPFFITNLSSIVKNLS